MEFIYDALPADYCFPNECTPVNDSDDLVVWKDRNLSFRILIIGRANAGKTTILERMTGCSEAVAQVWRDGRRLGSKTVKGQIDRGVHDVGSEIRFPSKPGFVFHDSQGIEAGSTGELAKVKWFVENAAQTTTLNKQLHAIWFCIPLDEARVLLDSEKEIFHWQRGKAPLIVIFTKRDGAVTKAMSDIPSEGGGDRISKRKARRLKAELIVEESINQRKAQIMSWTHGNDSPAKFLAIGGMEEPNDATVKACEDLITVTEEALNGSTLKALIWMVWGRNIHRSGEWVFQQILLEGYRLPFIQKDEPWLQTGLMRLIVNYLVPSNDNIFDDDVFRYDLDDVHYERIYRVVFEDAPAFSPIQSAQLESTLHTLLKPCDDHMIQLITSPLLTVIVLHSISKKILSSNVVPSRNTWHVALMHLLTRQKYTILLLVTIIHEAVAGIVHEIKYRVPEKKGWRTWKLSTNEAKRFAEKIIKIAKDNEIEFQGEI